MPVYQLHGQTTANTFPHYHVYVVLCRDGDGPGYVKFGYSREVNKRLSGIRATCPVPAHMIAVNEVGPSREKALKVERALLDRFEHRRIKGEWFRFDFDDPGDKRDFNDGCREVFRRHFGEKFDWWVKIGIKSLDDYHEERKRLFCKSRQGRKVLRRQKQEKRLRKIVGATE